MSSFAEYLTLFLLIVIAVFMAGAFGVLRTWYRRAKDKKCDAVFNFDSTVQTTTKLPIPMFAAECRHAWSVLDHALLDMPHEKRFVSVVKCDMCGVIDKTIETTSKMPPPAPPVPPPPAPPCRHQWETVEKTKLGSESEYKVVVVMKCVNCGDIDKTVESIKIPLPPAPPEPKGECRHQWETEKATTLDSAYEQMIKGIKPKSSTSYYGSGSKRKDAGSKEKELDLDLDEAPRWMFKKTYVMIRTCSKCGETDKIVASNIEDIDEEDEK